MIFNSKRLGCDLYMYSSIQSLSLTSDSLQPHGLQHARLPCPSPTPGAYPDSYPLSRWCRPTISSCHPLPLLPSIFPSIFSNESFPVSLLFASDGQSIGVSASASVLPMNIQDWFPLGLTGLISQSKGLLRIFIFGIKNSENIIFEFLRFCLLIRSVTYYKV